MYSKFYGKIYFGFVKIIDTINSCETLEELEVCSKMVDNWVNLIDHYCNLIYADRSNKHRKYQTNNLAEAGKTMFNQIQEVFQQMNATLVPPEYEGKFPVVRVRSFQEYGK